MNDLKQCPFCDSDDLYLVDQEEHTIINNQIVDSVTVPAIFCNCCKTITKVENDSPFLDNEKTYNYLLEKLNKIWDARITDKEIEQ